MITRNWMTGAAAGVACLLATTPAIAGDKKPVPARDVAVVAGEAVTEDELNAAIGNKLMRVKTEEYNARRASLEEIIANRLLRNEAAKRHGTVDELLNAEVDAKVSVPAAADLESFYDGVKERFPGVSKDEALKSIADGMRRQQFAKKKTDRHDPQGARDVWRQGTRRLPRLPAGEPSRRTTGRRGGTLRGRSGEVLGDARPSLRQGR